MRTPACLPEERIAELAEGRLDGELLARANEHLADCVECRDLVSSMATTLASAISGCADTLPAHAPAPLSRLEANDHVGRYVIERLVGQGAMGRVFAARDPALERTIALKLLRADAATPDLEVRLLREAKAMARISHPNVIAVHDAGRYGLELFIAMEFIEGGTLRDWLKSGPHPWREILDVYIRAGRGLAEAHAAGIIHRDFKPDNVLVGQSGKVVRVTDFGLARATTTDRSMPTDELETRSPGEQAAPLDPALTRKGALVGTPSYMAPEQHSAEAADARSDLYAFAIALYEALYGERPFAGTTLSALHAAKLADKVRPAPDGSRVPPRLRRVLLDALRANPRERPQSMSALLDALEEATRTPRRPLVAASALLAVGLTGALYGGGVYRSRTHRAAAAQTSSLVARPWECSVNHECVQTHGGEPWLCRASDHTCAPIASEECTPRFEEGDLAADDTVWLGALFPRSGPIEAVGRSNANAVELARREFAEATRSLSGGDGSLKVRRVAVAVCDDSSPEVASRAARHLVDDVGVPAILGFRSGQEVMDLAGSLLVKRNVLSIASLTSNPLITQLPQPPELPRMVWRTTFGLADVATAIARFIHDYFHGAPEEQRVHEGAIGQLSGPSGRPRSGGSTGAVSFHSAWLKFVAADEPAESTPCPAGPRCLQGRASPCADGIKKPPGRQARQDWRRDFGANPQYLPLSARLALSR